KSERFVTASAATSLGANIISRFTPGVRGANSRI
ncbi:MAG: hypothetical protein ACI8UP_004712, partial [Porticoccaceae bacterium]